MDNSTSVIASTNHGEHISNAPMTVRQTSTIAPEILRSEVDERITKIRPTSTPIDQISRLAGARHSGSMRVDYYSVDTKPSYSEVVSVVGSDFSSDNVFKVEVKDVRIFSVSETIMFPANKFTADPFAGFPVVGFITDINGSTLTVKCTQSSDEEEIELPEIAKGDKVVRMGRAAGELDVQTSQYTALPKKAYNYCQIFKAQIEESLYHRLADKEVGWSFSDQEEVAIIDMRLGMEKSFLFGSLNRMPSPLNPNDEIYFTKGIWHQTDREFAYNPATMDSKSLISMMRKAFTGGAGSVRKVLVAGSNLIETLSNLEYTRSISANDSETIWGVNFNKIVSKFGTLYVAHSEIFDLCGMEGSGMIIDPEYLTKYSHVPFTADRISFRSQGVRNTEATVLTEASCLVLRYPEAHMRVVPAGK